MRPALGDADANSAAHVRGGTQSSIRSRHMGRNLRPDRAAPSTHGTSRTAHDLSRARAHDRLGPWCLRRPEQPHRQRGRQRVVGSMSPAVLGLRCCPPEYGMRRPCGVLCSCRTQTWARRCDSPGLRVAARQLLEHLPGPRLRRPAVRGMRRRGLADICMSDGRAVLFKIPTGGTD